MLLLTPKYVFLLILSQFDNFLFCHFQDVQFGDIDYMIRMKDFTYDPVNFKGLPDFVRSIRRDGLRYIIILVSIIFCLSIENNLQENHFILLLSRFIFWSPERNELKRFATSSKLFHDKQTDRSFVCNNVIYVSFCIHGAAIIKTSG